MLELNKIYNIDGLSGLKQLDDQSVNCVIYSPPYWSLRSYLSEEDPNKKFELGQELTFKKYINNLIIINKEIHRVLKNDGCLFVNIDDTHYGSTRGPGGKNSKRLSNIGSFFEGSKFKVAGELKPQCLCNIPYRFAIRMTDELGWIQRNLIIWYSTNKFPESVKKRFTIDFEPIFFFVKTTDYKFNQQFEPYSTNYNYDEVYNGSATKDYETVGAQNPSDTKRRILESIKNGKGRNKRSVWSINIKPTKYKHTATYPLELINILVKAGSSEGDLILDPFNGIGTTCLVAKQLKRNFLGFDLSKEYCQIAEERLKDD